MINVKGVNENEKLQEIDHKLLYFIFYCSRDSNSILNFDPYKWGFARVGCVGVL